MHSLSEDLSTAVLQIRTFNEMKPILAYSQVLGSPLNILSLALLVFKDCSELYPPLLQQKSHGRKPHSCELFLTHW